MIFHSCALILLLLFAAPSFAASDHHASLPRIDLAVSFDIEAKLLRGTARIDIAADEALTLYLPEMKVTGALVSTAARENAVLDAGAADTIRIPASAEAQTLLISYEKTVVDNFNNLLSAETIVLTSGWHPIPAEDALFSLTAHVPDGFIALSQTDNFDAARAAGAPARFRFSQPQQALSFIAAPYAVKQRTVRDGLSVYSLFFETDKDLADGYLEAAAGFISRYEALIGEFPYNHYVIAENVMPTGYGIPTFTLLGQQVIRLPFIKQTSLGHEILHSWFGNAVDIAKDSGNWCEGLVTYLADMTYREDLGEGVQARKEAILTYQSYAGTVEQPLASFRGAGYERAANRGIRAIGYQKSALLFHELKMRIGDDAFNRGLRSFYRTFNGQAASWNDIRIVFENESGKQLQRFFSERLATNTVPDLAVNDIATTRKNGETLLSLTITQNQEQPFELLLPVTVNTAAGTVEHRQLIREKQETFRVAVDGAPLDVVVDAGYDLMRTLSEDEDRPAWSKLLGGEALLVVPADNEAAERGAPLQGIAGKYGWKTVDPAELSPEAVAANSLIFLDVSDPNVKTMYGDPAHPAGGFTLDIRVNPFNADETIGLLSTASLQETAAAVRRLPHYGKYAYLHFQNGRVIDKEIAPAANGMHVSLENRPTGIALHDIPPFAQLIEALGRKRVVYIGETHTSRPDHLLQLMLIEALHEQNSQLAIGMEMFPRSSQPALDRYIEDPGYSEADFLEDSGYFSVWGYDYRLFRPIFDFARKHRIPLVGLNIERDIVSTIFKNGSLEALSETQRQSLPSEMRLDMTGYIGRLRSTYQMHQHGGSANGGFPGFIQAQAVWDETMAESIVAYLSAHPETSMVVLAGSQHTRKDSGIPPRVARRLEVEQASVLNKATNPDSTERLAAITDYLFFLDSGEFMPQGKIGVILEESTDQGPAGMRITGLSPHSNAEAAGLRPADRLIFIDEFTIRNMVDVKLALLDSKAGDTVTVGIIRKSDESEEEMSIPVKLYHQPPM